MRSFWHMTITTAFRTTTCSEKTHLITPAFYKRMTGKCLLDLYTQTHCPGTRSARMCTFFCCYCFIFRRLYNTPPELSIATIPAGITFFVLANLMLIMSVRIALGGQRCIRSDYAIEHLKTSAPDNCLEESSAKKRHLRAKSQI